MGKVHWKRYLLSAAGQPIGVFRPHIHRLGMACSQIESVRIRRHSIPDQTMLLSTGSAIAKPPSHPPTVVPHSRME